MSTNLQKITMFCLLLFLIIVGLIYGKPFLAPLALASLFSLLLVPLCNAFEKKGLKRKFASILCTLLLVIPLIIVITLIAREALELTETVQPLEEQTETIVYTAQGFLKNFLGATLEQQIEHIRSQITTIVRLISSMLRGTFLYLAQSLAIMVLVLIYTFFFLYYRAKLEQFILQVTNKHDHTEVKEVIGQVQHMTSRYLLGILMVIAILAILNSLALSLLGIQHPLLLGTLAATLNVIPYIGVILGSSIPVIVTLVTGGSLQLALTIIGVLGGIQLLDNHFITPNIIGSQVHVNPLVIILFAVLGGLVWGIIGIMVFIPFTGIIKIILDHVPYLKPYAYLMSSDY
jgi:predicted PurR-regulated permease PerM